LESISQTKAAIENAFLQPIPSKAEMARQCEWVLRKLNTSGGANAITAKQDKSAGAIAAEELTLKFG
jgi:hypothetical protein